MFVAFERWLRRFVSGIYRLVRSQDQYRNQHRSKPIGWSFLWGDRPFIHGKFRRLIQTLQSFALFMVGLIITALLVQAIIPHRVTSNTGRLIDSKFEHFRQHKDDYSSLFLGSSILYRHIDATIFDNTLKEAGYTSKSFNFGAPAMKLFELRYLLQELMNLQPNNLDFVFIETNLDALFLKSENGRKPRVIYYHDLENTTFLIHYIMHSDEPILQKLELIRQHFVPFTCNFVNLGYLHQQIFRLKQPSPERWLGENQDGFVPLDHEMNESRLNRRQRFLARNADNYSHFRQRVERQAQKISRLEAQDNPNQDADMRSLPKHKQDFLNEIIAKVRSVGAEPVFLVPPALYKPWEIHGQQDLIDANQNGQIPTLLVHRDPNKYPNLFQFNDHFDHRYLNQQGAEKYTRLLGHEFSHVLRGELKS